MEKLFDVINILKVWLEELEELLDEFEVEHNELSSLSLKNGIKELIFYWLEKDFNELKGLVNEVWE